MNTISRTGIEAFDYTWNPVTGCLTGCSYCWASQCVKRFAETLVIAELKQYRFDIMLAPEIVVETKKCLTEFKPIFLESQFAKSFPKKPSRIVVGWMSDIAYWQPEWMGRVLEKIRDYPWHTFFFLTKQPFAYNGYVFPENCWLGITRTGPWEHTAWRYNGANKMFLSIEPLLSPMGDFHAGEVGWMDWVIVGAQTGAGPKVTPKREWVAAIFNQAQKLKIPVYFKDNLLKAVPGLPRFKEIPG